MISDVFDLNGEIGSVETRDELEGLDSFQGASSVDEIARRLVQSEEDNTGEEH